MKGEPVPADTKRCPWCAETILAAARKCKHCGEFLGDGRRSAHHDQPFAGTFLRTPTRGRRSAILIGLALLVGAAGVAIGLWATQTSSNPPPPAQTGRFYILSSAMYPTLKIGDTITVQENAYVSTQPATGDVIVFRAPSAERSECDNPQGDLVKRIVGTPGETIWSLGNTIYIDGHPLDQLWTYVNPMGQAIRRQTIPGSDYFVMGDNHPESCDSRVWGYVPVTSIIGKAITWTSTSGSGSL